MKKNIAICSIAIALVIGLSIGTAAMADEKAMCMPAQQSPTVIQPANTTSGPAANVGIQAAVNQAQQGCMPIPTTPTPQPTQPAPRPILQPTQPAPQPAAPQPAPQPEEADDQETNANFRAFNIEAVPESWLWAFNSGVDSDYPNSEVMGDGVRYALIENAIQLYEKHTSIVTDLTGEDIENMIVSDLIKSGEVAIEDYYNHLFNEMLRDNWDFDAAMNHCRIFMRDAKERLKTWANAVASYIVNPLSGGYYSWRFR